MEDPESLTKSPLVEEIFDLTVIHYCAGNKINSSASSLPSKTYFLGDDELTVSP